MVPGPYNLVATPPPPWHPQRGSVLSTKQVHEELSYPNGLPPKKKKKTIWFLLIKRSILSY